MSKLTIALLVILVILIVALIVLYFTGKKAQKKQEDQKAQIEAAKQTVSMLIIDKKRMPIKDSGLPQFVIDQTPKLMRRSKLPIVKAKVGPRIMTLVCEADIFEKRNQGRSEWYLHRGRPRAASSSGKENQEKRIFQTPSGQGKSFLKTLYTIIKNHFPNG